MEECHEVRIVPDEGLETVNAARKHFQVFDIILTSQLTFFFFSFSEILNIFLCQCLGNLFRSKMRE